MIAKKTSENKMNIKCITYSLLAVYAIPLFFISFALYATELFTLRNNTVYVADAISGSYFSLFRDTFGSIVVPLMTAYTLPTRAPDKPVPRETFELFFSLVAVFIIATILYGVVVYHESALTRFNIEDADGKIIKDLPKIFYASITSYAKESLAYIALILGISLKK